MQGTMLGIHLFNTQQILTEHFLGARPVPGAGQIVINKAAEQVSVLTKLMILVREGTNKEE